MRLMSLSMATQEVATSRRDFLKLIGGVGAGLTLGVSITNQKAACIRTVGIRCIV